MPLDQAIFSLTDASIGDVVCSMAAVQVAAKEFKNIYLMSLLPMHWIATPMSPPNTGNNKTMPPKQMGWLFNAGIGNGFAMEREIPKSPALQLLESFGIIYDKPFVRPTFSVPRLWDYDKHCFYSESVPSFDFLVHIHTSDIYRCWNDEAWVELFKRIHKEWGDEITIGLLGGNAILPKWEEVEDRFGPKENNPYNLTYAYDYRWPSVVQMMQQCKGAVITIDGAANRLAYAAGINHHVLLTPNHYSLEWSTHPGAYNAIGSHDGPTKWDVDQVFEQVKHAVLREFDFSYQGRD